MLGYISGQLIDIDTQNNYLIIEASGLGYEIIISKNKILQFQSILNQPIVLFIQTIVREDSISLFGFENKFDKKIFNLLISVNGIGPRLAIGILGIITAEQLLNYIQEKKLTSLIKLPGIGKKTAERIIIELHDKISNIDFVITNNTAITNQAINALESLGYKSAQAQKIINAIMTQSVQDKEINSVEELIRLALKQNTKNYA